MGVEIRAEGLVMTYGDTRPLTSQLHRRIG